ncbi:glycosyltransferase [Aquabacterium sp. A7-Y]|uniref:MGDG synthase family glycosyltransferase n=1 Tax=Aquabacterium sp. A7-Y TaxID=1349605 RepID=UPI00223E2C03|nr:glycosyltransferase [Aquabacterium sp. A7-Y]MCW7538465.1 glycosyltransferase [Aquabacterium sp. A7-Y]
MRPPHLLLLSVSAGAGHVRAAQAIEAAAAGRPSPVRVTHLDVLELVPASFRKLYSESYIELVERLPLLWAYLYQRTDRRAERSVFDRLRRGVERLNTRNLWDEIEHIAPDAIVCTHFLPAELLARRIKRGIATPPVWVQVTDFDVHGLWMQAGLQGYFVANDEVAWRLADRGMARERIRVTGIPVMPRFAEPLDRSVCAEELGLDPRRFTVVMMAGGGGVGSLDTLAERALALPHDLQVVALAGRNQELLQRLEQLKQRHPGQLFPLGFTRTVERVMSCADLVVTKPGGLSTSECLAKGLPMLLVSPIPGQEERNADYLLEAGAAQIALDTASFEFKLDRLLREREQLGRMAAHAVRIARPRAAHEVLDHVVHALSLSHAPTLSA